MRWPWLILGIVLIGAGIVWTLQGVGILPGSFMTGQLMWAIIGPIVALAGLALAGYAIAPRRAPSA